MRKYELIFRGQGSEIELVHSFHASSDAFALEVAAQKALVTCHKIGYTFASLYSRDKDIFLAEWELVETVGLKLAQPSS